MSICKCGNMKIGFLIIIFYFLNNCKALNQRQASARLMESQAKEGSRQLAFNFGRGSSWNCQRMPEKEGEKKKKD